MSKKYSILKNSVGILICRLGMTTGDAATEKGFLISLGMRRDYRSSRGQVAALNAKDKIGAFIIKGGRDILIIRMFSPREISGGNLSWCP